MFVARPPGSGLGKRGFVGLRWAGPDGCGRTHIQTNLRNEAYTIPPYREATARMPLTVVGASLQNPKA